MSWNDVLEGVSSDVPSIHPPNDARTPPVPNGEAGTKDLVFDL